MVESEGLKKSESDPNLSATKTPKEEEGKSKKKKKKDKKKSRNAKARSTAFEHIPPAPTEGEPVIATKLNYNHTVICFCMCSEDKARSIGLELGCKTSFLHHR